MSHLNGNDSCNIEVHAHILHIAFSAGTDCSCHLCVYFKKLSSQTSVLLDADKDIMSYKAILRPLIL